MSIIEFEQRACNLRSHLSLSGVELSEAASLEVVAAQEGASSWQALRSSLVVPRPRDGSSFTVHFGYLD